MAHLVNTDEEIEKAVIKALQRHPIMNLQKMSVKTVDGIVYLSGSVNSYIQKPISAEIIGKIAGVKNLIEDVEVIFDVIPPSDEQIKKIIEVNLLWRSSLTNAHVEIAVENGFVTITGTVNSYYQKTMVLQVIEDNKGVIGICNKVKIVSTCAPPGMTEVWQTLVNCATIDTRRLRFSIQNSSIELSGFASSMEERADAERALWSVPGITEVNNRIIVNYMNDFAY